MELFALKVTNEKQTVKFTCVTKITHITLDTCTADDKTTSLLINNAVVCNLDTNVNENMEVDFVFDTEEEITIQTSNANAIHMIGTTNAANSKSKEAQAENEQDNATKNTKQKESIITNMIKTTEIQVSKSVDAKQNVRVTNNIVAHDVKGKSRFCYEKDVQFCMANTHANAKNVALSTIVNSKNVKLLSFFENGASTQKMKYMYKAYDVCTFETTNNDVVSLVGIASNKKRKNKEEKSTKKKSKKEKQNNDDDKGDVTKANENANSNDKLCTPKKAIAKNVFDATTPAKGTPKKGIVKDVFAIQKNGIVTTTIREQQSIQKKGVQITILNEGTGEVAKKGDVVKVKYTGKLDNGKVFDKCTNSCFSFTLGHGEVIKGWDVGLTGAKTGEKRLLVIEPEYGYGRKRTGKIPANARLTFDVTVEKIHKAKQ